MLNLKPLTRNHVAAACRLSEEAAWNQTAQDWLLMTMHGYAVGLFEEDGTLAATALVFLLDERVAWISMVLVTPARRRQGLATKLLQHCLAYCEEAGLTAMLDATEAGQAVYARLGFADLYTISRWEGAASAGAGLLPEANTTIHPLPASDLDDLATWDHAHTGLHRAPVLRYCRQSAPHLAHVAEEAGGNQIGYILGRPGRCAMQLGPLIANETATARLLIQHALAKIAGPVYIDVPDAQTELTQSLIDAGFTRQRGFVRMAKAATPSALPTTSLYAIAGPDLG